MKLAQLGQKLQLEPASGTALSLPCTCCITQRTFCNFYTVQRKIDAVMINFIRVNPSAMVLLEKFNSFISSQGLIFLLSAGPA